MDFCQRLQHIRSFKIELPDFWPIDLFDQGHESNGQPELEHYGRGDEHQDIITHALQVLALLLSRDASIKVQF